METSPSISSKEPLPWTAEPTRIDTAPSISSAAPHRNLPLTAVKWLMAAVLVVLVLAAPTIIFAYAS